MYKLLFYAILCFELLSCGEPKSKQCDWIVGSWLAKDSSGFATEDWHSKEKGSWSGISKTGSSLDSLSVFEFVTIEKDEKGQLNYIVQSATNSKEPKVSFAMATITDSSFIASNLKHNFPKRIGYTLVNQDSLVAFIDDGEADATKKEFFYYSRKH